MHDLKFPLIVQVVFSYWITAYGRLHGSPVLNFLVLAEKAQQLTHLAQIQRRLQQTVYQLIKQDRHRLEGLMRLPILKTPYGILGPWLQRLDLSLQQADDSIKQQLTTKRLQLTAKSHQLHSLSPLMKLKSFRQKLENLERETHAAFHRQLSNKKKQLVRSVEILDHAWRFTCSKKRLLLQQEQKLKQLNYLSMRLLMQKKERFQHLKNSLSIANTTGNSCKHTS